MSEYPIKSTARKFADSDGNECTLYQLVKREPQWALSRITDLELKNSQLLDKVIAEAKKLTRWSDRNYVKYDDLIEILENLKNETN